MLLQSVFFLPAPSTQGVIFDLNLRRLVPLRRQTKQTKSSKGWSMIRGSLTRKYEGKDFRSDLQSRAVSHRRFQCTEITLSQTPRTDCTLNNSLTSHWQTMQWVSKQAGVLCPVNWYSYIRAILCNEQILKRKWKIRRFYHYAMNKY